MKVVQETLGRSNIASDGEHLHARSIPDVASAAAEATAAIVPRAARRDG
jgi:hypothetical protein